MPARRPVALAALACAAVRGLEPVTAQEYPLHDQDIDAALVGDDLGRSWLVRAPRTAAAAARLDQEARLLREVAGWLPFALPEISGTATLPEGGAALIHRELPGRPIVPSELAPGPGLAAALGRALAAVHELPERLVEEAGLAVYTAEEHRLRRLAEVDRAASTGQVPAALLQRWEVALEEPGAWKFVPCVVHGDLAEENVLIQDGDVAGLLAWGEARVGDPADDLAWITAAASDEVLDSVLEAYALGRREQPDPHLARRARLAGELALSRWLLHGASTGDDEIVDDAVSMLTELETSVAGTPW